MSKAKKNIKVRDLKPRKDAKGGGPHGPGVTGSGPGVTGSGPGVTGSGPGVTGSGPGVTGTGPTNN